MLSGTDALILLPFVLVISVWVAWSDMKTMKIPNKAVLALAGVFVIICPWLLPFYDWLWGLALLGIVLAIGFVLSSLRMIGAGDAKFAAAMAPFFVGADLVFVLKLTASFMIGALITHRLLKQVPFVRAATTGWLSWDRKDFPLGLAQAGMMVTYLVLLIRIDFLA